MSRRTHGDVELIPALEQLVAIVPAVELGERGEAGGAHPILKVLVGAEIGWGAVRRVAIGELGSPIRRRDNLVKVIVGGVRILLCLSRPGDALLAELIRVRGVLRGVEHRQVRKRVCGSLS